MAIFHCYVSSPEAIGYGVDQIDQSDAWESTKNDMVHRVVRNYKNNSWEKYRGFEDRETDIYFFII